MKRSLLAAIVAFASAGLVSTADASFEIPLEGDFYSQGAQGLVGIQESELASYEKQLMIEVNGLRPNSVYSVWLTRKDPSRVQGLGVEDYVGFEIPKEIIDMAATRWQYKISGIWDKADLMRREVLQKGYVIEDATNSYKVKRKL